MKTGRPKNSKEYTLKRASSWRMLHVADAVNEVHFVRNLPKDIGNIIESWYPVWEADGGVVAHLTDKNQLWVAIGNNTLYANEDSHSMFGYMPNIYLIDGLELINTSNTKSFLLAFARCGEKARTLTIIGLDNWDVSNVIDMRLMFYFAGSKANQIDVGDFSKWNVSKCEHHVDFQTQNKIKEPVWR